MLQNENSSIKDSENIGMVFPHSYSVSELTALEKQLNIIMRDEKTFS